MPELRKDPLTRRWVIIATERAKRPFDFVVSHSEAMPSTDCPFCEGHESQTRKEISAIRSKDSSPDEPGWQVRVVPNINPVLRIEGRLNRRARGVYDLMDGIGAHEILIESPAHISNLTDLSDEQVSLVLGTAAARIQDLSKDPRFRYALWFKNYGASAGSGRIDHARSQLIATPITPKIVKEELVGARRYFDEKERCLLCDLVQQERETRTRIVLETPHMVALTPFASRFPFEIWILPKKHGCDFARITDEERADLSKTFREVLRRLKSVLDDPAYNYLLHTAPFRHPRDQVGHWKTIEDDFHWHIELIPRLARVAGFEWGSGFYINPTPPEEAAHFLREPNV